MREEGSEKKTSPGELRTKKKRKKELRYLGLWLAWIRKVSAGREKGA